MKPTDFSGKKLLMIGGKGGVGKTTCSAALAAHFAGAGEETLLISSDPTPSLADVFETKIGPQETPVPGIPHLHALEINSEIILQRWKERFGPEIYEVLSAFARLDYDFVDYIGGAPGIEEEYMLSFIMDLVQEGRYRRIIWDTAPAGHTLRLLHLPELFLKHLEAAARFYMNLYGAFEKIAGRVRLQKSKRTILEIIEGWQELSRQVLAFIRDETSTSYLIVTIAEALGVRITERLLQDFDAFQLPVSHLIINYLIREADCPFHRDRQGMQKKYVERLRRAYGNRMDVLEIPLFPYELTGVARVSQLAGLFFPPPEPGTRKKKPDFVGC